jgi:putative transposase
MLGELSDFIDSNPDARELKRAVAVQMFLKGYRHRDC